MPRASDSARNRLHVCRYCDGAGRHTCTSFTCGRAVREAEREYRKERELYMEEEFSASRDKKYYGKTVMAALQEVLEIEPDSDIESIRRLYSLDEILDAVLVYEGIIGYSGKLVNIVSEIFGINLLELDV